MKTLTLQSTDWVRLMQGTRMRMLITVINLLLVVWIAWLLASLTWDLLNTREPLEAEPASSSTQTAPLPVDRYAQLARQLPDWHLFGEAAREAAPTKAAAPVDAPDTRLKLVLRGAFSSGDEAFSRAIIADPRGKEEMYAIGDKLPGNAELHEVHADRVILMRGGRYETLRLPLDEPAGKRAGLPRSRASNTSRAQRLGSIRQTLKQNPKSLYGLVRTRPKKDEEGKMIGYILQPGRDPQLFEQMGLQPGDVVTQINDISLDNLSNGMRALKSAESGATVSMTVMRGDLQETLSFSVPE